MNKQPNALTTEHIDVITNETMDELTNENHGCAYT